MALTLEDRLRKHSHRAENGCLEWTGGCDLEGYGFIKAAGRQSRAHRVAYEVWVGPIPDGYVMDHLCCNPSCIEPTHLEPVTSRENILRSDRTQAAINVAKTHCPQGHAYADHGYEWGGRRYCRECRRIRHRRWVNANRERSRELARQYRERQKARSDLR